MRLGSSTAGAKEIEGLEATTTIESDRQGAERMVTQLDAYA